MFRAKTVLRKTAFTLILSSAALASDLYAQSAATTAARVAAAQAAAEAENRNRSQNQSRTNTETRSRDNDQSSRSQQQNRDSDQARATNNSRTSTATRERNTNNSRTNVQIGYSSNRYDNRSYQTNRSSYNSSYDRTRYHPLSVKGSNYFYRDGRYYRYQSGRYLSVNAPIGARVSFLPTSAVSISYGNHRYFRVGLTWYLGHNNYYEVIERPPVVVERQVIVQEPQYSEQASYETSYDEQRVQLVIYPANGQSENQQDRDNYECYRWSRDESSYDPTEPYQDLNNKEVYIRAMTACMESRGYTVR